MPPIINGRRQCPECHLWCDVKLEHCERCYAEMVPPTYASMQKQRIHHARLVEFEGHVFIAKRTLDLYDEYSFPEVGDILVVQGHGDNSLFFELAAYVEGWGEDPEPSFMLLRIDPDDSWPKDWQVLDVDPEEAVILRLDKAKKEGRRGH